MFSITSTLRAVARQSSSQWRSSLAGTALVVRRANSSSASSPLPSTLSDVSDVLYAAGDAIEPTQSPTTTHSQYAYNYDEIDPTFARNMSNLRPIRSSSFFKPNDYTREQRLKESKHRRPPLLGPDAAESRRLDIFHQLEIDPLNECTNSVLLSHFVTEMGKVKPRALTNLTWKNQRRMGKAIRRAKMMGIIPLLSKRPLSYFDRRERI